MKIKPIMAYFLLWLTGSLFGFYWAYRIMQFINKKEGQIVYNFKRIALFIIVFFAIDIPLFLSISQENFWAFPIVFLLHLAWIVIIFRGIYQFAIRIEQYQKAADIYDRISPSKTILFMFLYFTAVPYIQSHINKLYEKEESSYVA